MLIFLQTVILVTITAFLFYFSGRRLLGKTITFMEISDELAAGLSYFIGMAIFLFLIKVFTIILGLKVALFISLILLIIIAITGIQRGVLLEIGRVINWRSLLFAVVLFPLILSYWLTDIPHELSPFTSLGSLHAAKYSNLSIYLLESNRIPIIKQNYGQSLLAIIPMFFVSSSPYLALFIWLWASIIATILTIYGFLKLFINNAYYLFGGMLILMLGNISLSLTHVLVIDSGSPLLLNGYTDSLFSLCSFIYTMILLNEIHGKSEKVKFAFTLISIFMLGFIWNITSPQNNIILIGIMFSTLLVSVLFKHFKISYLNYLSITGILIISTILGLLFGGMLTPNFLVDNLNLPGMIKLDNYSANKLGISPYIQHFIGGQPSWKGGLSIFKEGLSDFANLNSFGMSTIFELFFRIEAIVWNLLRVIFYPLVGLILLGCIVIKNRRNDLHSQEFENIRNLFFISIVSFVIGSVISFVFKIGAYKWELSRFLIIGYSLSMACLIISLNYLFKKVQNRVKYFTFMVIVIFIIIGPSLDLLFSFYKTVNHEVGDIWMPLQYLINTKNIIGY